jgi:hypothetical protein
MMHLPRGVHCAGLGGLQPYTEESNSTIDWYFESITIDYSVGLALWDPRYQPNPWFSTWHILSSSALITILLTRAGKNVKEDASMNMFKALRRWEDYERKMRRESPLPEWVNAFVWYNAA